MGATATAGVVRRDPRPETVRAVAERVKRRISLAMVIAHTIGALDVGALLFFVLPTPGGDKPVEHLLPNLVAFLVYLPIAIAFGHHFGTRESAAQSEWVRTGREPSEQERIDQLDVPLHCAIYSGVAWVGAAIVFGVINADQGSAIAWHIACTILMGGLTTCAIGYLLTERLGQPIHAIVLAAGPPLNPRWPGVEGRLVIAWLSATGVPLLGLLMVALDALHDDVSKERFASSVLVLVSASFVIGLTVMLLAARAVSGPLTKLRRQLARVLAGDLSAEVTVADTSEVGVLESGFNSMVAGLRERERVRDLFNRQVGEDVARTAIEGGTNLGGEVRDVAVLFVDIIGSTKLAQQARPERVVARLNRFFAIVVDVIDSHGGWVNKFEGDAALCIFGAPASVEDASGCALAAARALNARLKTELPGIEAGIGLSAGHAVAGWIGAERRFEYTVIGDPVNEAARLCELAKQDERKLLASEAIVRRATDSEAANWRVREATLLRGRAAPTRIAVPSAA